MPTDVVTAVKCSKVHADGTPCGKDVDAAGFPRWCKKCRATYQREWHALKGEMCETRGYASGVSSMRDFLAVNFEAYALPRVFSGAEIGHIIRTCGEPTAP